MQPKLRFHAPPRRGYRTREASSLFRRRTPAISSPQAVARLQSLELGGLKQWLLIRGQDRRNPLLLFLHGGPGVALIGVARPFTRPLEQDFVIVHWDQRGAGLSFTPGIPQEAMSVDRHVEDVRELTEHLLMEFGQRKLFLFGHSWGTAVGVLAAARYPHLFHAYIGLGQIVAMAENEAISHRFVWEEAERRGDRQALRALTQIGAPPYAGPRELFIQRRWLERFGCGNTHRKSLARLVLPPAAASTEYLLSDWLTWFRGLRFCSRALWNEVMKLDLRVMAPRLGLPVYFMAGRHDYMTPHVLTESYLALLRAPRKDLVWFEGAAHSPWLEDPEGFARALRRIREAEGP